MSLARGEAAIHQASRGTQTAVETPTVVIAIAPSIEERIRLARLVTGLVPVLLVSSREEALALLGADACPSELPTSSVVEPPPTALPTHASSQEATGLHIDSDWRVASWGANSVSLSPLEHDLLGCLLAELGHTLTFEWLHRQVWGNDHLGGRSDLQSVVKRLRRKLRALGSSLQIHAVRGVGLRLTDPRVMPRAVPMPAPRTESIDDLPA